MKLVLLHSPLVGSGTWTRVAELLRARGHDVGIPDLAPMLEGGPPYYSRLALIAALGADDAIVVVHSGAGALVPEIATLTKICGAIFVDALLPHPGKCWFETVPEQLNTRLRKLARGGVLPRWHLWWPKGAIETLLPDARMYDAFVSGLREMPLAYFEEFAPDTKLQTPSAYLQLSEACKADADRAQAEGWPVARLKLHHLAMLTHAGSVAEQIERLAALLTRP